MARQLSLFDFINSSNSIPFNEQKLKDILEELKIGIKKGVINKTDTYFDIAYHREPKIVLVDDVFELRFAQASASERLLSAYEANNDIEPLKLLAIGLPQSVKDRISFHIEENPNDKVKDIFTFFNIWDYPKYNWVHAQSKSIDEINKVKELIIEWAKLKEEMLLELSDNEFSFMRASRRKKTDKNKEKAIPQCFDGLCLEQNFMKLIKNLKL